MAVVEKEISAFMQKSATAWHIEDILETLMLINMRTQKGYWSLTIELVFV